MWRISIPHQILFVKNEDLTPLSLKGQGWNEIEDLSGIFSDFVWEKHNDQRFLPKPERISWQTQFNLPNDNGVLLVTLKQAIQIETKTPLLIFELKVYKTIENECNMREWYDLAREWIVRGFTDLTTFKIHNIWEIENNA